MLFEGFLGNFGGFWAVLRVLGILVGWVILGFGVRVLGFLGCFWLCMGSVRFVLRFGFVFSLWLLVCLILLGGPPCLFHTVSTLGFQLWDWFVFRVLGSGFC